MKITTYIDKKLLQRVLKAAGARSQREALEQGLRNLLADIERKRFVKEFDSLRLNTSLNELKRLRA